MFIPLGGETVVRAREIVGIFDTDNATLQRASREFLKTAEKRGEVVSVTPELPKAFVVCQTDQGTRVYLCALAAATLRKRCRQ